MSFDPVSAIFDLGKSAIERIWPDPIKRAEEVRKLEEMRQTGDMAALNAHVQLMVGQIEVNKVEAGHKSIFVSGARPSVIWVGSFALAWAGIIHPLLTWVWMFAGIDGNPPPLIESGALTTIVSGLLGVAGMRSFDKSKGVQTDSIG